VKGDIKDFLEEEFFNPIKKVRKITGKNIHFFVIMGNDDPRIFEEIFKDKDKNKIINYVHLKTVKFSNLFITGYSYVPPTPFQLKDWEKYDVSRYVDVGAISPESGIRTVKVDQDEIICSTMSEDIEKLSKNAPIEKTIFLFHSPPYNSNLDHAAVHGKLIEHVPMDIHAGSIAIQRFIEKKQPMLTLHGHIHETVSLTKVWKEKNGKTFSFSGVSYYSEFAVVFFDTEKLEKAERKIFEI
jgi:Icc-related predicted phosphoesterase